jgi:myotubularin-related protein 6/7/8
MGTISPDVTAEDGLFKVLANEDFSICDSYPSELIASKHLSDELLLACSQFRTRQRMPTMTYYHQANGCSIWRSSQPMAGVLGKASKEDI